MINQYFLSGNKLATVQDTANHKDLIWVDMHAPDKAEELSIENLLGIDAPTREEMHEIEVSSRLYSENGALYITATLVTQVETDQPETHSVTFIIKDNKLVTLRYSDPKAFSMYLGRVSRGQAEPIKQGFDIFLGLMEAIIDRLSDTLEFIGRELDSTSKSVFQKTSAKHNDTADLQDVLKALGRFGDLNGKLRESLLSLSRVFSYLLLSGGQYKQSHKEALETYAKDISSLTEHANYVSNRVNLLLDATLGMINIEQNAIIKIFSVAAVVFLPPTLIASIYGMNFEHMPELDWLLGYPFAIGLMILSAILPFLYFKKKGWL